MEEKKIIVTPVASVKFPELSGKNLGDDGEVKYSAVLTFDPKLNEVKEFLKTLNDAFATVKNGNTPPYKDDYAKEDNGDKVKTGLVAVSVSSKYPVKMYDSKKKEIEPNIGWGSKVKAAIKLGEFDYRGKKGISKYLIALQVIELRESGYTAESIGFGDEDGYTSEVTEEVPF